MGPRATIVADSISPAGDRVTTMEVTMHRFVLAEFNTHRVFSRNSASSRAIPLGRQIARLREELAYPVKWASERPGMQGGDEIDLQIEARDIWMVAAQDAVAHATALQILGVHKSIINRLLEPFMWHTVIVTSTEWENFFDLRCHELAQPEIRAAAELMRDEYRASEPTKLDRGQWHAPYGDPTRMSLETMLKTSVARCAWVSTMNHDGDKSWDAIERMYDRLTTAAPMHASPLEHQCTPADVWRGNLSGWSQLRHMVERGEAPWEPSRAGREGDEQSMPVASEAPVAHMMVQGDLEDRLMLGIKRYGQPLQPFNGRDSLRDAYEEVLDLAVYLRNEIYERENG